MQRDKKMKDRRRKMTKGQQRLGCTKFSCFHATSDAKVAYMHFHDEAML